MKKMWLFQNVSKMGIFCLLVFSGGIKMAKLSGMEVQWGHEYFCVCAFH